MPFNSELYWVNHITVEELRAIGVEGNIHEDIDGRGMMQVTLTPTQVEELIPKDTFYCYTPIGLEGFALKIKPCPFHDVIEQFPKQNNGHCHYLRKGDDAMGGLLWDSCKECGINKDVDD